jgi:hypothetical protein
LTDSKSAVLPLDDPGLMTYPKTLGVDYLKCSVLP